MTVSAVGFWSGFLHPLHLPDEYSGLPRLFTAIIGQSSPACLWGKDFTRRRLFQPVCERGSFLLKPPRKGSNLTCKTPVAARSNGRDGLQVDRTPTALHHPHPQLPNYPGKQERAGSVLGCYVQTGSADGIMTFTNSILMRGGEKERYVKCTKASISTSGSASGTN